MPNSTIQAQIAFKNLLGKSQTNTLSGVLNEVYGYSTNVSTANVWASRIPQNDPTLAVANRIAIGLTASLVQISDSFIGGRYYAYQATWTNPPDGIDPKTNQSYTFGKGALVGITGGDGVFDIIPSSYGNNYEITPYDTTGNMIPIADQRDWVFQYSSGIFFQSNLTFSGYVPPSQLGCYYYIGDKLSNLDTGTPDIIRLSTTGPSNGVYSASSSTPLISTYSVNHLYLIDFAFSNTSSVQLNINSIGTFSILKWGLTGLGSLSANNIIGSSGSVPGPIYYLTWSPEQYFQFYENNPTQNAGEFKNLDPISTKLGGIEIGHSFDSVKFSEMFGDLLYPEQQASYTLLTLTNSNIIPSQSPEIYFIDLGQALTGDIQFDWDYANLSNFDNTKVVISDITNNPTPTLTWPGPSVSNLEFDLTSKMGTFSYGPANVTITSPNKRIFTISGKRKNNTLIPKRTEIHWTWRGYYGSSTFSTLDGMGVTALSSSLMTQSIGSITISGTEGYKYLVLPDSVEYNFSNVSLYNMPLVLATDGYPLVDNYLNYNLLTVTNSYNVGTTYRIYRSMNQINGTISVTITK
jgi:hypothetical protein